MDRRPAAVLAAALIVLSLSTGCSNSGPNATPEDENVTRIVKESGGDWNKVSQTDRERLTRTLGNGNEQNAAMALRARAARNLGKGPPVIGPPGR